MTLTGTLEKNDLEGGHLVLKTEEGQMFTLEGLNENLQVEGYELVLEGELEDSMCSVGMTGPVFNVTTASYKE